MTPYASGEMPEVGDEVSSIFGLGWCSGKVEDVYHNGNKNDTRIRIGKYGHPADKFKLVYRKKQPMKPNFEEARKRVNRSEICDEYKDVINDVLDGLEGRDRKPKTPEPKAGQVWRYRNDQYTFVICESFDGKALRLVNITEYVVGDTVERAEVNNRDYFEFIAPSLESYFEKKARGEL